MPNDHLYAMRHTAAHVLAAASARLYPGVKLGVGPVVDNGFFYDILFPMPITEADLERLESEMHRIIQEGHDMVREELSIAEAIAFFESRGQDFKVNLLRDLQEKGTTRLRQGFGGQAKLNPDEAQDIDVARPDTASIYRTGEFVDLCRGPHVGSVKEVGAFKLWKLAGAYWRGDEKNAQLQRVYGLCFETQKELEDYLVMLEEAKKRDHRKIGMDLDLFVFSDLVGSGLPLWTPKGTVVREQLDAFVWELRRARGYVRVEIPHITKKDLYEVSGHWDKFKDELFKIQTREGHTFAMKPMNCPHHTQIFARKPHSYREMPQRLATTTMCYRDEQTGELHGLSRLRSFTQDDAHVFCREAQVKEEAMNTWDIIETFYGAFGFTLKLRLSTHDPEHMENYLGDLGMWGRSVAGLEELLKQRGAVYDMGVGEAAFYGPKIDFLATDSIGRQWQVATIQVDRNLPERFGLNCVNEAGVPERIVMIHAAIMGSIERFLSNLLEHTAGALPFWLAPVQIQLATVSSDFVGVAQQILAKLVQAGVRAELDDSDEKVGKKIRTAAMMKIPWTIVVGVKEAQGMDFKVNVFGQEEDLVIPVGDLVKRALEVSRFPLV